MTGVAKRKICVVTGTRAEYGLLYWTLKGLSERANVQVQIIATGMHLSPQFGNTWQQIEKDGFRIDRKVEILLSSDTAVATATSMGLAMMGFAQAYEELKPDLVVVLGDRYEILAAASAAMVSRLPIAHIHGGEKTEGAMDEAIRHAISKMAHLHFTSTEEYRHRVIQLGEQPGHVWYVGAPGLDNIRKLALLDRPALEESLAFPLGKQNFLITFHPVTLAEQSSKAQFEALLSALEAFPEAHLFFTYPNSDPDGLVIIDLINAFVQAHAHRAKAYTSLGQLRYLSLMAQADAVIGNSSSGIIETPSFRTATVNIGERQAGRVQAASTLNCAPAQGAIVSAIQEALSPAFREKLKTVVNPYSKGDASAEIVEVLATYPLEHLLMKHFYDIPLAGI